MSPTTTNQRRIRELSVGIGSVAGILALIIAPWWLLDVVLIGMGAASMWWARTVPLHRVLTARARLRVTPVLVLGLTAVVAYSTYGLVERIALLFAAALMVGAVFFLVSRWYRFVERTTT